MQVIWLLAGWLAAFGAGAAPALMPPAWAVLAAFAIGLDVPLLPLGLGAAAAGAAGRLVLARATGEFASVLREEDRHNAEVLGAWFSRRGSRKWLFVALYCAGPFPSNVLFIAAGAGHIHTLPLGLIYAAVRAVTDTFWAWVAIRLASNVRGLLTSGLTDWKSLVAELASIAVAILIFRLPWSRWLAESVNTERGRSR